MGAFVAKKILNWSLDPRGRGRWAVATPAPDSGGTEMSFIGFWDNNIICAILPPSKTIRNSNRDTSTGLLRPDFGVLTQGICIFRGEENSPTCSGDHPKRELIDKLTWTYDPAPCILGEYFNAIGYCSA
jgi:hypothetical protein